MYGNKRIAVVIPYYQRQYGILRRSVLSAFAQRGVARPYLIIVDDESPVPARSELKELLPMLEKDLVIIDRPNGGPAAARNTGLDAIPDFCELIAFLDSDDEWVPTHLRNACEAIEAGCDFYFSDHLDYSGDTTRFGRLQAKGTFRVVDHPQIQHDSTLHWFMGDFVDQLIHDFVVQTATVVMRRSLLGNHRFPISFRRAGEDHLFWMQIAASGAKVAFSDRVECTLGKGVNIYEGSGWGTEGALKRSIDFHALLLEMRERYAKTKEQKKGLSRRLIWSRSEFISTMLHNIAHKKMIPVREIMNLFKNDPLIIAALFPETIRIINKKIKVCYMGGE